MHPKQVSGDSEGNSTFFLGNIKCDLFSRLKRNLFKIQKSGMIKNCVFPYEGKKQLVCSPSDTLGGKH